jgi:hypothetical protein
MVLSCYAKNKLVLGCGVAHSSSRLPGFQVQITPIPHNPPHKIQKTVFGIYLQNSVKNKFPKLFFCKSSLLYWEPVLSWNSKFLEKKISSGSVII